MPSHILVIDDDPAERRALRTAIEQSGYSVETAENSRVGLEMLKRCIVPVDLVILDLVSAQKAGFGFLAALQEHGMDVPVIVQTGQGSIESVVQAMRAGAFDFVVKPVSAERIGISIANALRREHNDARDPAQPMPRNALIGFETIVTASPAMLRVIDLARRAAHSTIPVVLEGESGVGKDMVARAIHAESDRADKRFVTVNCSAKAPEKLEEILFGKAGRDAQPALLHPDGRFSEAEGGTLFLDEIGDLPLDAQYALLQASQQGDVRLITATRKDLVQAVHSGQFREDLYYRLNVYPIAIPALRKRKEDIPVLVRMFVERFVQALKLAHVDGVSADAMALLMDYDWPGNVRQLENVLYRAVAISDGPELSIDDFPHIAGQSAAFGQADRPHAVSSVGKPDRGLLFGTDPYGSFGTVFVHAEKNRTSTTRPASLAAIASVDPAGHVRKLAEVEEELIRFALGFYRGRMSEVARKLGIGRSTLYRKLRDYNIDPDHPQKQIA
ncbi:MAG: acetoacetate metabolism regulatory protein AtoC [Pseudomonadota bacterium]